MLCKRLVRSDNHTLQVEKRRWCFCFNLFWQNVFMCSSWDYENVQTRCRLQPSRSINSVYLNSVCHSCLGLLQSWEWGQTWVILPSRVFPISNKNSALVKERHNCSLVGSMLTPQPSKSPKAFQNQGMSWGPQDTECHWTTHASVFWPDKSFYFTSHIRCHGRIQLLFQIP